MLISITAAEQIREDVMRAPGVERCGLLLGDDECIRAALPCANRAADPRTAFEIDPAALLAAHRRARAGGPAILGHYHSHPAGRAMPSPRDAAAAHGDGALWMILAGGDCALFRAVAGGAILHAFARVPLRTVTKG